MFASLQATHIYCELDEAAEGMKDALHDLLQTLESAATEAGVVTGLVDTINKSIVKVNLSENFGKSSVLRQVGTNS